MKGRNCAAWWTGVALATILAVPSRAVAANDADELIRQGVVLRRQGDDATALQRFQQAFQIDHSSRAMAQIALAEQALGRWVMAYEHLNQALAAASDPWITKNRELLTDAVNRVNEHVGLIDILGGTAGAEVRIGGVPRGKLPLGRPIPAPTGTVIIDLVAPGFATVQRTSVVRAREITRESFDEGTPLAKAGATMPPAAKVEVPPAGGGAVATPVDPTLVVPPVSSRVPPDPGGNRPGSFRPMAKWVAWGVGAAALGVGIFGAVRQNSAGSNFAAGCGLDARQEVVLAPGSTKTLAECRDLKDQVDSDFQLEVIGLVSAGVLAATGLVLWLTEPAPSVTETAVLSCAPGMTAGHGPWIGCRLTF